MMDITPLVTADRQIVNGYGDLGFTVTGHRYEGSVLIFPDRTVPWPVSGMEDVTLESLSAFTNLDVPPGILLLGCGKGMKIIPKTLRAALKQFGIVIEPMDTGAACRTYNILLTEGRSVAAALIAV